MLNWADIVYVFELKRIVRIREYTGEKFEHQIQYLYIDDVCRHTRCALRERKHHIE